MIYFRGGQLDGIKASSPTEDDVYADWDHEQDAYVMTNEDGEVQGLMKASVGPPVPAPLGPPVKWYKNIRNLAYLSMILAILTVEVGGWMADASIRASITTAAFVLSMIAFWLKP